MEKLIQLVLVTFPDEHNELYYAPLGSLEEGDEVLCETGRGKREIGIVCADACAFEGSSEYRLILKASGAENFRLRPVLKKLVDVEWDEEACEDDRSAVSIAAGVG